MRVWLCKALERSEVYVCGIVSLSGWRELEWGFLLNADVDRMYAVATLS